MEKIFDIKKHDPQAAEAIGMETGTGRIVSALLTGRGVTTPDQARLFLNPSLKNIRSPFLLKDMNKAVERIYRAVNNKEKILVFGDYDVDGMTSTALLLDFFSGVGADTLFHIPHRTREGYGLKDFHVDDHAEKSSISLIITVDCGSSSIAAGERARDRGIDLIITDHHEIDGEIPHALAIVNPKQEDCPSGLGHLAGVGVAFYLVIALRAYFREKGFWPAGDQPNLTQACDLVAMGTVADVVPLIHENRIITSTGLKIMGHSPRTGIKALLEESGVKSEIPEAEDIGFKMGPRINASGRMGDGSAAVDLLISSNSKLSKQIAISLSRLNEMRKEVEQEMIDEAVEYLEGKPELLEKKSIVLAKSGWHTGVIGIVASKLKDRYMKPVVVISKDGDLAKGSARSIEGFNMYQGLYENRSMLEYFGGHAMAAGLTIKSEKIAEFREIFEETVKKNTKPEDFDPKIVVDYQISFDDINEDFLDELYLMKPFGCENPEPLFCASSVTVSSSRPIGKCHRKLVLRQNSAATDRGFQAIHFNVEPGSSAPSFYDYVFFNIRWNHWNGNRTIQLVIRQTKTN